MRGLEERLRLALEGTETGFWEWDIASDTVEWSENMGPMYGLPRGTQPSGHAEYIDRHVDEGQRAEVQAHLRAALDRGEGYEHDLRIALPDGGERWLHSRARVLRGPDGRPERIVGLLTDVTERRRREDAHAFLDAASQVLSASLDPVETLDDVARLAVPRLADWCAVQLAPNVRGAYEQVAVAHVDPAKVRWARELQDRYPPDPDAPTGAPEVIRSGRSELYPVIDAALLEAAALDDEQREIVRQLQMNSGMIVPMVARGRTLGAITFVYAESGRQYGTRELELAEELGRRAGLALDHARLFAREHQAAETLQRRPAARRAAGDPGSRARRALPAQRRARPRRRRLVRRVRAPGRALWDRRRRRRRPRHRGRGHDGADPQRAARLRAQGRRARRRDGRSRTRSSTPRGERSRSPRRSTSRSTRRPARASWPRPATCRRCSCTRTGGRSTWTSRSARRSGSAAPRRAGRRASASAPGDTLWLYTDGLVESRERPIDAGLDALAALAGPSAATSSASPTTLLSALPRSREDDVALLGLRRG